MSNKSITIRDVAHLAGVSVSTVSRILSDTETNIPISEATRNKVINAAKELSYRPHPGARLLRGKCTNLLGIILREIDDLFFAQLVRIISLTAQDKGLEIVLGHARSDPHKALRLSEMMLDLHYCDGILLLGDLHEGLEDNSFLIKMNRNLPLVQVCRGNHIIVEDIPSVNIDNDRGIRLGLEYLTQLGHQQIAFLSCERLGDLSERQDAYCQFMVETFGKYDPSYLQHVENSMDGGYLGMSNLLNLTTPPTAVFASDDTMAMGAIKACFAHKIRIPNDISLIGFDDIKLGTYLTPSLTTIHQPIEEIGKIAVEQFISLISGDHDKHSPNHIILEPKLVIRDSCCAPSQ